MTVNDGLENFNLAKQNIKYNSYTPTTCYQRLNLEEILRKIPNSLASARRKSYYRISIYFELNQVKKTALLAMTNKYANVKIKYEFKRC